MRKSLFFLFALSVASAGLVFADVQIDKGQSLSVAPKKFTVVRFAQSAAEPYTISKDDVVIWDSTSKDGITIKGTTTSSDPLVAGILLDTIVGISSDNTAAEDESDAVWGRMQTWGIYLNVTEASGANAVTGANMCTSTTSGSVAVCSATSEDDSRVGVALEAVTGAAGTVDIFVRTD